MKYIITTLCTLTFLASMNAHAAKPINQMNAAELDAADFNPRSADANRKLEQMRQEYKADTGLDSQIDTNDISTKLQESLETLITTPCRGIECHVFVDVQKSIQRFTLYVEGKVTLTDKTSTGRAGFATPNFGVNPDGRVFAVHSSSKYPGYNNMPFAVFISGGYAIHGAPGSEELHLGQVASHGCVRVKTSNAKIIMETVSAAIKAKGRQSVWISVRP